MKRRRVEVNVGEYKFQERRGWLLCRDRHPPFQGPVIQPECACHPVNIVLLGQADRHYPKFLWKRLSLPMRSAPFFQTSPHLRYLFRNRCCLICHGCQGLLAHYSTTVATSPMSSHACLPETHVET